jgi:hypothetical protein
MATIDGDDVKQEAALRVLQGRPCATRFVRQKLAERERKWGDGYTVEPLARPDELPPEVRLSLSPEALAVAEKLLGGFSDVEIRELLSLGRAAFDRLRAEIAAVLH